MDRRKLPLLLMLLAGAMTALIVYFKGMGLLDMLIALLAVMIIFNFIGTVIKNILDSFDKANEKKVSDEGEVIEKEADEAEQESDNSPA